MLLVGNELSERKIVLPYDKFSTKNSTLELTIGEIFPTGVPPKDWAPGDKQIVLRAGGMVNVVTEQRLHMPHNVTGLATLVTSLTQKGVLCLNVGVIDPLYVGHLSATLVNFSKNDIVICEGQRLFRTLIFEHSDNFKPEPYTTSPSQYKKDTWTRSRSQFGDSFLDMKALSVRIRRERWSTLWAVVLNSFLSPFGILAGIVAAIATVAALVGD